MTVVQKTTIDSLHKEGKKQKVITKEAGCSQSAVYKNMNGKLNGRKKCGRKRCTSNRDNRSLERIVKIRPFKNLGEIHKEWTAAGVRASRATTHRLIQDMGFNCRIPCVRPLLNYRQRQRRLTWAKDKKDCSVVQSSLLRWKYILHLICKSRSQTLEEERRGTESKLLEVQFKVSTVGDGLGSHVICWCWSTVFSGPRSAQPSARKFYSTSCFPLLTSFKEIHYFIFQQDLAPEHTAKGTSTWFKDHGIPLLDWPANPPDLNPWLWGGS